MGQVLQSDLIGSLSHNSGIITLAASRLTIGGQQYIASSISRTISTDVTMVADTLYMIFAIVVSGVVQLRISANFNSTGPAGFTSWKLVGAFYADGMGSPAFGSFVNIEGVPQSNVFQFQGSGSWTNTIYSSRLRRNGDKAELEYTLSFISTPSSGILAVNTPTNLTMDITKLSSTTGFNFDSNLNGKAKILVGSAWEGLVLRNSNTSFVLSYLDANANEAFVTPAAPASFSTTGHYIHITVELPISGWTNTPIKDL